MKAISPAARAGSCSTRESLSPSQISLTIRSETESNQWDACVHPDNLMFHIWYILVSLMRSIVVQGLAMNYVVKDSCCVKYTRYCMYYHYPTFLAAWCGTVGTIGITELDCIPMKLWTRCLIKFGVVLVAGKHMNCPSTCSVPTLTCSRTIPTFQSLGRDPRFNCLLSNFGILFHKY